MDRDFNDIRPYRDHEVPEVMKRLAESSNLVQGMGLFLGRKDDNQLNREEIEALKKTLREIKTVSEFQKKIVMKMMVESIIKNSVDTITGTGVEELASYGACLFISNHRDITLDPAFQNYLLTKNNLNTFEIAFGDNLLINEFVSDLIRVNKSFIVKRNLPITELLESSIHLSNYIEHTHSLGNSVWIAQREGRAKDGNDVTNPAVIKMLTLSQRETGVSLTEFIRKMKIIPVAISYEFDPCDKMKGLEIFKKMKTGEAKKSARDDMASMNQGISGYKGRVHISFSKPIEGEFKIEKEVAETIDRSIQTSYRLWPSNYIAYDSLTGNLKYSEHYTDDEKIKFLDNYTRMPEEVRQIVLEGYANPVKNREKQVNNHNQS